MRQIRFAEKEFYHLYNRGVDKRTIFAGKEDYDRFLGYLFLLNDEKNIRPSNIFAGSKKDDPFSRSRRSPIVALGAYSLMPSHFHLLATPLVEGGISKFMHRLQTAYTMYFNEKHQRTGSLFEGTFKAKHARNDELLKYLFAYIHLSPAELFDQGWESASTPQLATLSMRVSEYQYSSVGEYITEKSVITSPKQFPKFIGGKKNMMANLNFWIKYRNKYAI